jgi:RNA polymerase sigma-54 factor
MSGIGLQQNISLGQTLSPQMQQSLHFLQAPVLELRSLIQQEIQTNPLLEENPTETEPAEDEEWDAEQSRKQEQAEDWRDYFTQNRESRQSSEDAQAKRQFFFDSQIKSESLADHLIGQLILATSSEGLLKAGEEIIGNLNDDGFLMTPIEDIASATGLDLDLTLQALALVQSFHPAGVGARDLPESLCLQLLRRGKEDDALECKLARHDLDRLARKRYQELARDYKVSQDRIREAAHCIAQLNPRPGSAFAPDQPHNIVQAEAAFIQDEDGWDVILHNDSVPRIRINDTYKDLLGHESRDTGLKDYLRDRIRSGKFLIKCLQQRQQTIENILREIIRRQSEYLYRGNAYLKPMTMSQVADAIGVHETTVSRAVAGKYVQTPHGVVPMKFFFTSGYKTAEGESMSNTSIKDAIAELIAREEATQPLSDAEIVSILKDRGIDLARRTVAKYRAELNILPSNLRREH